MVVNTPYNKLLFCCYPDKKVSFEGDSKEKFLDIIKEGRCVGILADGSQFMHVPFEKVAFKITDCKFKKKHVRFTIEILEKLQKGKILKQYGDQIKIQLLAIGKKTDTSYSVEQILYPVASEEV